MNAWIDCMTYVDQGMTSLPVAEEQLVVLEVQHTASFALRCPEQCQAFIDACAVVNERRQAAGERKILALMLTN